MIHYTLNTGDTRVSPRSEVGDHVIDAIGGMLVTGEHEIPQPPGYRLKVTTVAGALIATVFRQAADPVPLVTFGVAADAESADELWPIIERDYLRITELPGIRAADFQSPRRPSETPWCAAYTLFAEPAEAYWIADLERCVAWAWIEKQGSEDAA